MKPEQCLRAIFGIIFRKYHAYEICNLVYNTYKHILINFRSLDHFIALPIIKIKVVLTVSFAVSYGVYISVSSDN